MAIYTLLASLVDDPTKIFNSTTDGGTQHWFWGLPLTSADAAKAKGNANVRKDISLPNSWCTDRSSQISIVVQECTSSCPDPTDDGDTPSSRLRRSDHVSMMEDRQLVKRDGGLVNAHNVEEEMAFISQPRGKELTNDFVYDSTAGTGQTVYIVDTGAGLANTDVGSFL